ncbi:hypothetical protein CMK11_15680 [Candidatus Poribacteria bacterium]|nr:hypothetical protein [Candidatus Poribacteria bacterium]
MRDIYRMIPELTAKGSRAAYCTVVDTVGSTPQKEGAKLLILPTMASIGTLGGGCVEAEARKQAARLMQSNSRKLLEFKLDSDYGWDDGLICGGSMRIFVDLTDRPEDGPLFIEMDRLLAADIPVVVGTVVEAPDADIVGAKRLIATDGTRLGALGSEAMDDLFAGYAVAALEKNDARLWTEAESGITMFVEAMLPQTRLVICGAGHVGAALTHFAAMCDFHVTVIDDRPEFANAENLPDAHEIIVDDLPTATEGRKLDPLTYVVIVTRGHNHDESCLRAVIESDAGYIGMIGSRRKIKLIYDDLKELGIPESLFDRVQAPIGMDISSNTVPEIAVSIVAQLIQVRNTQKVGEYGAALA